MKRYIHRKYFLIYILLLFIYACKGTDDYSQANNNPTADLLNKSYKDSLRTNPKEALQRLEALCNQVTSDSVYYYTLRMNIAECHYINGKLKESEVESQRIIAFCKRWNPQESVRQLMFHALNNCGVCLQEMGNRNEAINRYKEAEKYADAQEQIAIYINMADCYQQSGNFLECSKYYRKALTLADQTQSKPERYSILAGLAKLYMEMENFQEADIYFRKAELEVEKSRPYQRYFFAMARGTFYYVSKDYASSIQWFHEAQHIIENLHQPFNQAIAEGNLGELFILTGKADSARYYLDRATKMFGESYNNPAIHYYMEGLYASLALLENNLPEAERLLSQPFKPEDVNPQYLYYHNLRLEQLYQKKQNYKKAYYHKQIAEQLNDSLRNIKIQNNIAEMESRYRQDTTLLRKDIQLAHAKEENRHWKIITVSTALGLLLILLFTIGMVLYNRKKKDLLFQKQKATITGLRMEVVRNRVSPHFIFNALNIILPAFRNYKELEHPMRLLINVLKGNLLFSEKIAVTLEQETTLVKEYLQLRMLGSTRRIDIQWKVSEEVALQQLIPAMCIQIPVENAIKYAFTEDYENPQITITAICTKNNETHITIEDNGIGYNPALGANDKRSTGNGLKILYQTIELLNTKNKNKMQFSICNKSLNNQGKGTLVSITIPNHYAFNL